MDAREPLRTDLKMRRELVALGFIAVGVILLGVCYAVVGLVNGLGIAAVAVQVVTSILGLGATLALVLVAYETLRVNERLADSSDALARLAAAAESRETAQLVLERVVVDRQRGATDDIEFYVSNSGGKPTGIRRVWIEFSEGPAAGKRDLDVPRRRRPDGGGYSEYPPSLDAGDLAIYRARMTGVNPADAVVGTPCTLHVEAIAGRSATAEFRYGEPPR